jgi:phosphonate transport system substrate-binding protein
LHGRSWAYNEPHSQSGYGITRYHLVRMGQKCGYFARVVEAGYHEESIRLVASGRVDASAIDAQVLAVAFRDNPGLAGRIRVIDSLGPSPIQPVVASRRLPVSLRQQIQAVLLEMGNEPATRAILDHGFIDRFVAVDDGTYDPIRQMLRTVEAAGFLDLR